VSRKGSGARERQRQKIKYFNGLMDEYVRIQMMADKSYLVVINLLGTSRIINVPYKSYASLLQAALISFGREGCYKYLEGEDVSTIEAEEAPEAPSEDDAAERYSF
jgi:hypothetical protein